MNHEYILRFYVAGVDPDMQNLIITFKEQLNHALGNDTYTLEVVDILDKPHLAEEQRILATPTVVRMLPGPIKKIILNLNEQMNGVLGIDLLVKEKD